MPPHPPHNHKKELQAAYLKSSVKFYPKSKNILKLGVISVCDSNTERLDCSSTNRC